MPARSVDVFNTPPGMGHVRAVLKRMTALATEAQHEWPIRQLAVEITKDIPSKSPTREIFAIYKWVRDHIRYRMDPHGLELVQAPRITLEERAGDCDDITTLIWALCGALGHPWRGRTVGRSPQDQQHVQAQVFDRKRWIDVDPVIEPPQPTTAPRDDVGMFAMFAGGADHLWDSGGRMLAGRPRRVVHVAAHQRHWPRPDAVTRALRRRGLAGTLGAPADAVDRSLWQWCAYYPPWGAAFEASGGQPPQPGVWTQPDSRYRGAGAPGYMPGVMPAPVYYAFHAGQLPAEANLQGWFGPVHHPQLGAGFFKKLGRGIKKAAKKTGGAIKTGVVKTVQTAHNITHKGPIGKATKAVKGAVTTVLPFTKPFVELQDKVFAKGTHQLMHKAGVINEPGAKLTKKGLRQAIPAAAAAAASSGGGKIPAVKAAGQAAAKVKAGAAKVKAGAAKLKAAKPPKLKPVKAKKPKAKTTKPAIPMKDAWKIPHPELRRKYPAAARMLFDPGSKKFRVFIRKPSALNGLGLLPSISFHLGAAPSTPAEEQAARAAAQKMGNALDAFIAKNKRPPAVSLPAVLEFQKREGTLKQDGLYGDNTKAAGEYYAGRTLPKHAPALKSKSGLTWKPPAKVVTTPTGNTVVVQPKPKPQPAPKPVVIPDASGKPKVVTPVQTDVVPVPAGYTEVGREANNPGLPPIGAPDVHTGTAVGTKPKPKPAPSGPGPWTAADEAEYQRKVDAGLSFMTQDIAQRRGAWLDAQKPGPIKSPNNAPSPGWQPAGGLTPVPVSTPVYVPSGPLPSDNGIPDRTPIPGPVYPMDVDPSYGQVNYGPVVQPKDDDTLLWLAVAYLWSRSRKRAA